MGNGQYISPPTPGSGNVLNGPSSVLDMANPLVLVGGLGAFAAVPMRGMTPAVPATPTNIPVQAQLTPVVPSSTKMPSTMMTDQTSISNLKQQWLALAGKVNGDVDNLNNLKMNNPDPAKLTLAQSMLKDDSKNLATFVRSMPSAQLTLVQGQFNTSEAASVAKASSQMPSVPAGKPSMAGATPSNVNITPAAEYDYAGFGPMGSGLGPLLNTFNPVTPITQLPSILPAGTALQSPNIIGDASKFSPGYLEWKRHADPWDYLSARKYFSFKDWMQNEYLEDWQKYGEFKQGKWRKLCDGVNLKEYLEWKAVATEDDSRRFSEWKRWNSLKAKYKSKFQPQIDRYMVSKKRDYQRFWKSLKRKGGEKEYSKFLKFQAWQIAARNAGQDVLDLDAYHKWSKTYIPNESANHEAFQIRKPTDENMKKWIDWMRFEKVRNASAEDTEASQSYPFWYKNTKNYSRRYRLWWNKRNGRDDRRDARDARRNRRDEDTESSSSSDSDS